MVLQDTLNKIGIGATGVVGSEIIEPAMQAVSIQLTDWSSALTQVIIALATVVSLFRKKKGK